jgi:glycogen operon protein
VEEFKSMVSALHEADIEIILDVVYNHTCEGNHEGPTLSYRGIDHDGYYRLVPGHRDDYDVTGTGNSFDTAHADVLRLVLDSLHYWVEEMGVDGFRFDLATTLIRDGNNVVDQNHPLKQAIASDPVFSDIKFIAEPWDIGPAGYQVGAWGAPWAEWNDKFRACIRDYWRGALPGVRDLATRLAGSPDVYDTSGRTPAASVNFITAHDGFTARDLVSYNGKHNEANGEDNRDGSDDNRSWNCGAEGDTDDPAIVALRHRQVRNLMLTLLLADGTPMLTAGDEMGRTQLGNNNAYCQDSPISWTNWEDGESWSDIRDLVRQALAARATEPLLRPASFRYHDEVLEADGTPTGRFRLAWLNEYSGEMGEDDWNDPGRRLLGMYVSDETSALVTWYYSGASPLNLRMPPEPWGKTYQVVLTSAEPGELPTELIDAGESITLPPRTTVLMRIVL